MMTVETQPRALGKKNAKAAMKSIRLYLMQTSRTDSVAESFRVFAGELEKHMECQKKQSTITSFFEKERRKTYMGCDDMKPDERHNSDSEQKSPRWTWRETAYTVTVLKDTLMKMIAFFSDVLKQFS